MGINYLSNVVKVPRTPSVGYSTDQWLQVEKVLGTNLPEDYKLFVATYGAGYLGEFIWVYSPFAKNPNLNLSIQVKRVIDTMRVLQQDYEIERQYPLFPHPNGLLPWGKTDNGDVLFWLTIELPENWEVVINESRSPVYEHYRDNMSGFLYKILIRKITSGKA